MKIEILTTGDELLEGVISDTNASYLAHELHLLGFSVHCITTIGDQLEVLSETITQISQRADLCIMTGGLGPTSDDLTLDALAISAGAVLKVDESLWEEIQQRYTRRGVIPPSNRRQARIPSGGEALKSEVGTAPGMKLQIGRCLFFAYPGVPSELRWHTEKTLLPSLRAQQVRSLTRLTWRVGSLGESALQDRLNGLKALHALPHGRVGYQALGSEVRLKITSSDPLALQALEQPLRVILDNYLISESDHSLEEVLLEKLMQKRLTLGCAESCTGGGIASRITSIPGSSGSFMGGIVAYSNQVKQSLLQVTEATLIQHGAVSAECAQEMALGARQALNVDWAISVTGVAGPGGGSDSKPVGTVFFAWAGPQGVKTQKMNWKGDRERIQSKSSYFALHQMLRILGEED